MEMGMAIKLALLTLGLLSCGVFGRGQDITPLTVAFYHPPTQYQVWADQALHCAKQLKESDPTLPFEVVLDSIDINQIVWGVVATERADRGFKCRIGICVGIATLPDTILLSSWYMYQAWVVRHEVLHLAVVKETEDQVAHGVPWGLCEVF